MFIVFTCNTDGDGNSLFYFTAIFYNIENAITFVTSKVQDTEVIYGPISDEDFFKKNDDVDYPTILLICDRNQCPMYDFSGYCIEECEPLDETQYIMK